MKDLKNLPSVYLVNTSEKPLIIKDLNDNILFVLKSSKEPKKVNSVIPFEDTDVIMLEEFDA